MRVGVSGFDAADTCCPSQYFALVLCTRYCGYGQCWQYLGSISAVALLILKIVSKLSQITLESTVKIVSKYSQVLPVYSEYEVYGEYLSVTCASVWRAFSSTACAAKAYTCTGDPRSETWSEPPSKGNHCCTEKNTGRLPVFDTARAWISRSMSGFCFAGAACI